MSYKTHGSVTLGSKSMGPNELIMENSELAQGKVAIKANISKKSKQITKDRKPKVYAKVVNENDKFSEDLG